MPNPIPEYRRQQVMERDRRCVRCGGEGCDPHHRRSRAVKDQHQHCSCNLLWLCRTCHDWAHRHPVLAKTVGMIVSRYNSLPGSVPVQYPDGLWTLDCDGGGTPGWHHRSDVRDATSS